MMNRANEIEEMMMLDKDDETAELMATVEEIRSQMHADLDKDLVEGILRVQRQHAEDRAEARKQTELLINRWAADRPEAKGR